MAAAPRTTAFWVTRGMPPVLVLVEGSAFSSSSSSSSSSSPVPVGVGVVVGPEGVMVVAADSFSSPAVTVTGRTYEL